MNMDIIRQLGALALGSRFKRISNLLMKNVGEIYKSQGIDFEPKWFPIFYLLKTESPLAITEIAKHLSFSHPAVNQLVNSMLRKKIVREVKDKNDERRRLIELNEKGLGLLQKLEPVWKILEKTTNDILLNSKFDLLGAVDDFEQALMEKSYLIRVKENLKAIQLNEIEIIEYDKRFGKYFEIFNRQWLEKYFRVEDTDLKIFSDPEKEVLKKGGYIFFAKCGEQITGTVALFNRGNKIYELAKMAVPEQEQGKQIGRKLLIAAVEKGRVIDADKIILYSNTKLIPAINLYKQYGFVPVPLSSKESTLYERANIKMELLLK